MMHVQPVIPLVILVVTLALSRRLARYRRVLTAIALLVLFLWSWPPFVILTSATLEHWYPASDVPTGDAEVIVVLGGGIEDPFPSQPQALAHESTYRRVVHAAWLHQHWKPLPVLASGGPMGKARIVLADVMRRLLVAHGVPDAMVWTERRSRSTAENARLSAELLRSKGISKIALVTEGCHMLRAEKCFRKQGLTVVPAPCFLRSAQPISTWKNLLPQADAILGNEASLHEWVGLAWYWLRGEI
jgi:uncharacterized SAM-binding protein YcdF (DUF218 family)